jgi:hypothetical protein
MAAALARNRSGSSAIAEGNRQSLAGKAEDRCSIALQDHEGDRIVPTRIIAWLAIVLTALALVPAGAHLFELPNKMKLAGEAYFMVQNIYRGWAWLGIVLVGALAADLAWAARLRGKSPAFPYVATAAGCVAATLAVFFAFTLPANLATDNWTAMPADWAWLRLQWEAAHAANAGLTFVALGFLAYAALMDED